MVYRALHSPSVLSAPARGHFFLPPLILLLAVLSACSTARPPAGPRAAAPEPIRVEGSVGGLIGTPVRSVPDRLLGPADYDLPITANSWVESELDFLVRERRQVVQSWLEWGDIYQSFVEQVLRDHGLPTDLYHLAMIESGFVPAARSRAGAVGMWQFMPATGNQVGLRIDAIVDERMDPVRSTRAAAVHLRALYRQYGDWELAAAAYNAGPGRISRGMARFGATNFWQLAERGDLAAETRHYVPRLYAMTIIGRDPERFGFARGRAAPMGFDSIFVEQSVALTDLARVGSVSPERLREMNPHFLNGTTPAGGYWVWVPEGEGIRMQRAVLAAASTLASLPAGGGGGTSSYTVRWGDSLGRISQRSGVPSARIRQMNPSIDFDRLPAGVAIELPVEGIERLNLALSGRVPAEPTSRPAAIPARVPEEPVRPVAAREAAPAPSSSPALATVARTSAAPATRATDDGGIVYVVQPGESLWGIAREHGITIDEIRSANGIRGSVIVPGQRLRLPGAVAPAPTEVEHVVAPGETLWAIARRHDVTIDQIRSANGINGSVIVPGQRLVVPIGSGGGEARATSVVHVVQGGETLWGIARRYNTTIEAIRSANSLGSRPIIPGQRLTVPL